MINVANVNVRIRLKEQSAKMKEYKKESGDYLNNLVLIIYAAAAYDNELLFPFIVFFLLISIYMIWGLGVAMFDGLNQEEAYAVDGGWRQAVVAPEKNTV